MKTPRTAHGPFFSGRRSPILPVVLCAALVLLLLMWAGARASHQGTETAGERQAVGADSVPPHNTSSTFTGTVGDSALPGLDGADASVQANELSQHLDSLLADLTSTFNTALQADHRWHAYLKCVERLSADAQTCRSLKSAAFFYTLEVTVFPDVVERVALLRDLNARFGVDAVLGELVARLSSADGEHTRLVVLTVATCDQVFGPHEFPADAYARLDDLSVPEQTMLMSPHETLPIRDNTISHRVAAISVAPDTDIRTRRASIKALGHGNTAEYLARTTEYLRTNPATLEGVWLKLGEALGRCGSMCVDTVEALARGTRRERRVAYEAILTSSPDQAQAFQQALVRVGEPQDQDEDERRMREHAIHLGGR